MTSILNNVSNFLWTKMEADNKPAMLSIADNLLPHWNFPSHHTEINDEGLPKFPKGILFKPLFNNRFLSNFKIFGTSFFATMMLTSSIGVSLLPSMPALFTYSAISFSAKAFISSYVNAPTRADLLSWLLLPGTIYCTIAIPYKLFYLTNAISFIAFNLLIGISLKFLAYKVYPQVQAAYDNFLAYMKAGDEDSRADNDRALSKHFARQMKKQTDQNWIPSEVFALVTVHLTSQDALRFRSCNKQIFRVISNRNILEKKIVEYFPELTLNEKDANKVSAILNLFYTCPLKAHLSKEIQNPLNYYYCDDFYQMAPLADKAIVYIVNRKKSQKVWAKTANYGLCLAQSMGGSSCRFFEIKSLEILENT